MRTHSFRDSIDKGFVRFVGNVMFYVRQHESKQIAKTHKHSQTSMEMRKKTGMDIHITHLDMLA